MEMVGSEVMKGVGDISSIPIPASSASSSEHKSKKRVSPMNESAMISSYLRRLR